MKFLSLTCKDMGYGLELAVEYQYEGKTPDKRQRRKAAEDALKTALETIEKNEQVDVGYGTDSKAQIRRDQYVVEQDKK